MSAFEQAVAASRSLGWPQPAPAPQSQIDSIASRYSALMGSGMPVDYEDFLLAGNGFQFDGATAFGLSDAWHDGAFLAGLFESNERLLAGERPIQTNLRFVGESGNELYALDTSDGDWKIVDRISWQTIERYDSFAQLFDAVFTPLLERKDHQ